MANNRENKPLFVQLSGIIIFALTVGYFLVITNPPADLLEYDNALQCTVTKNLSNSEIVNHLESISFFLILYTLIAFFISVTSSIVTKGMQPKIRYSTILVCVFTVVLLGYLLIPYYGGLLAAMAYSVGMIGFYSGMLIAPPLQLPRNVWLFIGVSFLAWVATYLPVQFGLIEEIAAITIFYACLILLVGFYGVRFIYKRILKRKSKK